MKQLKQYRRVARTTVTAVRLDLETEGLSYRKWGGLQHGKRGDWIVDNAGDVYTIDADSFAKTYRQIGPGTYEKVGTVWAEAARAAGAIKTKEGASQYVAGDMLVYNDAAGHDGYAMTKERFESLYEAIDS